MRKSLRLTPQALPELLLICPPGTLNFAEPFEQAKRLGIADRFFDLLESTGYPPLQGVPTTTLDRWHQFWGQQTEALTQRALRGDLAAQTLLWGDCKPELQSISDYVQVSHNRDVFCAQRFIDAEIERWNPDGREARTGLLAELAARGAPPEVLKRLQEICLIAGFLVSACLEAKRFWEAAGKQILPLKQQYRARRRQYMADRGLSDATKALIREEIDTLLALLDNYIPRTEAIDAWRRWLQIDKKATISQQKQRIWSIAFEELLELLRPYSQGKTWDAYDQVMPEEAYRYASRLMSLYHPTLWPDRPGLVKRRWHDAR